MIMLSEYELPLSERLLITLHNLCATYGDMARKSDELVQILQTGTDEVNQNLNKLISEGYVADFTDNERNRKFYLTSTGIIRVSSLFS